MGRMNVAVFRYMEHEHFRILIAIEMGMRNHELVPIELIGSIAKIHRGAVVRTLKDLAKHGTVAHERGKRYDGYRLTTLGYDVLALRALTARQVVGAVGNQIGVGKESDVFVGGDSQLNDLVLKFHRLGRTSFRKLKEKRDYHKKRKSCSWLYLSSLAAAKEFAFLKALYNHNFPLPRPIDRCRHVVVMDLITGFTLCHVQQIEGLYEKLMTLIVRLARYGLIHGDFNEFNIMLTEEEEPILIDLPQMVSLDHPNAQFFFERDVNCVRSFFKRRFNYESELYPKFEALTRKYNLDVEVNASGFTPRMSKAYDKAMEKVQEDEDSLTVTDEDESDDESSSSRSSMDESNEHMLSNTHNNRLNEWIKNAQDELEKLNIDPSPAFDNCSYNANEKDPGTAAISSSESASKISKKDESVGLDKVEPIGRIENRAHTKSVLSVGSTIAPEIIRKRVAAEVKAKQKIPLRVKGKANALLRQRKTNKVIISHSTKVNMEKSYSEFSKISIPDNTEFKLESFVLPQCYYGDLKSVLIPKGLICDRIKCLAREIFEAIGDKPLIILCILKGSFRFFTELVDELVNVRSSCVHKLEVEFIRVKSYTNSQRSGTLEVIGLLSSKQLENKNVLVVEDIVDSGTTMSQLLNTLEEMGVKQKWTAVLLSKRCIREYEVKEDFVAFDIPDKFVVGFGLDYNQKFRDLGHICIINEAGIEKYRVTE
uniref:Serine/threonine-protein kinase RIO2 n=1 Tax=Setaria digitata TaxID=48799 RepID=A0A915PPV3_9BILA